MASVHDDGNDDLDAQTVAEIEAVDAELGVDTAAFDRLLKATPLELHHTLVPPIRTDRQASPKKSGLLLAAPKG